MTMFFTSDTHFSHERILILGQGRPFSSIQEHDETLIERWNEAVKPNDIVYHLGDVALGKIAESLPLIGRLNGHKILCPGNHDRIFSGVKEKQAIRFLPEYMKVFQELRPESFSENIGGFDVVLSHFPYVGDSHGDDRYSDNRPKDNGLPLIHGHVHSGWKSNGRMFNVGVDVHDFRPVSQDVIIDWLKIIS